MIGSRSFSRPVSPLHLQLAFTDTGKVRIFTRNNSCSAIFPAAIRYCATFLKTFITLRINNLKSFYIDTLIVSSVSLIF
jgi:hypothetical protein